MGEFPFSLLDHFYVSFESHFMSLRDAFYLRSLRLFPALFSFLLIPTLLMIYLCLCCKWLSSCRLSLIPPLISQNNFQ